MPHALDMARYYFGRLGMAGMLGALLIAGALIFTATLVRSKEAALQDMVMRNEQAREAAAAARAKAARLDIDGLQRTALVPEAAAALRRLHDAAGQSGLELAQGEYRLTDARDARFRSYQFLFPVYGSYEQVRTFLALALNNVPALALTSLQLRRESIEDTELEVVLGFTLYLEAAP
jgi:hypothetical protein